MTTRKTAAATYTTREIVDYEKLKLLVSNFHTLWEQNYLNQHDPRNNYREITDYETNRKMLYEFLSQYDEYGNASVSYCPQPHIPDGRLWSAHISLQNISRRIRHTIARGLMVDLDIENAHPTFLLRLCGELDLVAPNLTRYIHDRNELIQTLLEDKIFSCRDDAKRAFLTIINGGGASFSNDHNLLKSFAEEMRFIRRRIIDKYPTFLDIAIKVRGKNYYNLYGSALNYLLCQKEREILDKMIVFCQTQYHHVEIGALCHDGLMLHYKEDVDYHDLAARMTEHCGIKIVVKEMDEVIPTDGLEFLGLDDSYNQLDADIIKNANTLILSGLWNAFNVKDIVLQLCPRIRDDFKFLQGQKANDGYWYERRHDGRWSQNQDALILARYITLRLTDVLNALIHDVDEVIRRETDDEVLAKRKAGRKALLKTRFISQTSLPTSIIKVLRYDLLDNDIENKIDADSHLIGFDNGVYDLHQNRFRPIGNNDYIRKTTHYNFNPVSNPTKRVFITNFIKSLFMPRYARMVDGVDEGVVGDEEDANAGYDNYLHCLIAFASILLGGNKYQKFYMLIGDGSNGKSTLINLVKKALGDYACNIDISSLVNKKKNNNSTSDLPKTIGCRILITNESEATDRLNTSFIKNMTGDEEITEREVFSKSVTFKPKFVPFLLTNNLPRLNLDAAIARRIQVISFSHRFFSTTEDRDFQEEEFNKTHFLGKNPGLQEKLFECANEFMLLLIETYNEHVRDKNFITPPQDHLDATANYLHEQDTIAQFIQECCQKTEVRAEFTKFGLIKSAYLSFSHKNYINEKVLARRLKNEGFDITRTNAGNTWNLTLVD